ncbi:MAG: DUF4494 domain-containing protein [Bacteroidaceae bacterium]|nr:DUF4494 domain-containing protein [Bacteroidaceae bacterium]
MRSKTATWFEAKIQYEKQMEDGLQKKVTEQYVVDALSYAEAEERITDAMSAYISGEFEVKDLKKAQYKEVFFEDKDCSATRYYKAKLDFLTLDEKTEKEKRSRVVYLVQAENIHRAIKNVDEVMGGTMIDYEACAIDETKILDVFEYRNCSEDKDNVIIDPNVLA